MTQKLYTLGYSGWTLDALRKVVVAYSAILADIRMSPWSRHPDFTKARLQYCLGQNYLHVQSLGNINYKGGPITIKDYRAGKAIIVEAFRCAPSVILMCGCSVLTRCHRYDVSGRLSQELSIDLEHLQKIRNGVTHSEPILL